MNVRRTALALAALSLRPRIRILEVGTGSGCSAAVLAGLGREVVSVECFGFAGPATRERLERLESGNVALVWADGIEASPALGLFDRILVHGAFEAAPTHLLGALGEGGALIGAVGEHEIRGACSIAACPETGS